MFVMSRTEEMHCWVERQTASIIHHALELDPSASQIHAPKGGPLTDSLGIPFATSAISITVKGIYSITTITVDGYAAKKK